MTKTITAALFAAAFALPASYALAMPQHMGGHAPQGHATMPMNQDVHGDAVSDAAHAAKAEATNVGKSVSQVANAKNKGEGDVHGDAVSETAHTAKADDANVGKTVSQVANDKNNGERLAKGHTKTHHAKAHHAKH